MTKNIKSLSIKSVKWSFSIKTIQSIIFDSYLNFDSILIEFLPKINDKILWKTFIFIDHKQCLKFNSILQNTFYYQSKNSNKLISINCKDDNFSIYDELIKIRKLDPNNTTKKYVKFVKVKNNKCLIQSSDSKYSLNIYRNYIIGISTDYKLLNYQFNDNDNNKKNCYFSFITNNRIIAFIAKNKENKDEWIDFVTKCGIPVMNIDDYEFYKYINNES